jgi:hypothetical protein
MKKTHPRVKKVFFSDQRKTHDLAKLAMEHGEKILKDKKGYEILTFPDLNYELFICTNEWRTNEFAWNDVDDQVSDRVYYFRLSNSTD